VSTSFYPSLKFQENPENLIAQLEYASVIGILMYVVHCTRLDISYIVCKLASSTNSPSIDHWKSIERILNYLKRTKSLGLYYNRFSTILEGYLNASWFNGVSDKISTTR
jgi:hypothetical protein